MFLAVVIILLIFTFILTTGGVYFINDNGQCGQTFSVDGPVLKLLYYEERNVLITVTESLMLTQHAIMPEGESKELLRVGT